MKSEKDGGGGWRLLCLLPPNLLPTAPRITPSSFTSQTAPRITTPSSPSKQLRSKPFSFSLQFQLTVQFVTLHTGASLEDLFEGILDHAPWKAPTMQTCWASGSYICSQRIYHFHLSRRSNQSKPRSPIIMEKLVCLKQAVESSDFQNWTYLQQYKRALCTKFPTNGNKCFLFFEISQMVLRGLLLLASAKSFLLQEHCNNTVAMQHWHIVKLSRGIN